MKHGSAKYQPMFRDNVLIILGSIAIMAVTLFGVMNDPGQLIKEDVTLGPIIAAGKTIVPLFLTIAFISLLAKMKKCATCGKILLRVKSFH